MQLDSQHHTFQRQLARIHGLGGVVNVGLHGPHAIHLQGRIGQQRLVGWHGDFGLRRFCGGRFIGGIGDRLHGYFGAQRSGKIGEIKQVGSQLPLHAGALAAGVDAEFAAHIAAAYRAGDFRHAYQCCVALEGHRQRIRRRIRQRQARQVKNVGEILA